MPHNITAIVLTFNEEIHIKRCIENLKLLCYEVLIVDSYSSDQTIAICKKLGVRIYQNTFVNQAQQFNWALENCNINTDWVLRLDADEYMTPELIAEIKQTFKNLSPEVSGFYIKRRVYFLGKWIKYGGYYPTKLLRLWKHDCGKYENRWMDEHVILEKGEAREFKSDMIDDNLNNLTWWTQKHNSYSSREAIDILNQKHQLIETTSLNLNGNSQSEKKRKKKQGIYLRMPLFIRAYFYFIFRYFIKLGFLDGKRGFMWHFLQGFWYRFLVDAKVYQIEKWAIERKKSIKAVIEEDYGIRI